MRDGASRPGRVQKRGQYVTLGGVGRGRKLYAKLGIRTRTELRRLRTTH